MADRQPYKFRHNEPFRGWFAWCCLVCKVVRLEESKASWLWLCPACQHRDDQLEREVQRRVKAVSCPEV